MDARPPPESRETPKRKPKPPLGGEATMRKALNRGWRPIGYHDEHGWRYGWLVEELSSGTYVCQFPGDERNTRIHPHDQRHVRFIHKGTLTTTPLREREEVVDV